VTVPMHCELRPGLLRRLMRDVGISREELLEDL
jgi:predicted RNA binding protein YcfA (HicA-like mRNA interferase family)